MDFAIINVPSNYGCDKIGVEEAPKRLFESGLLDILNLDGHNVKEIIDLSLPQTTVEDNFIDKGSMKNLCQVVDLTDRLFEIVKKVLSINLFPLVIGGDHSIALGSVKGSANIYNDLGVVWLDAHADMNTEWTSPTGNIHGMPLAALMGLGDNRLQNHINKFNKLDPQNIFLVGARALDAGEKELIDKENINVFSTENIKRFGVEWVGDSLKAIIHNNHIENIHFSIDIDVLDPQFAPGTGVKEEKGINPSEFLELIRILISTKRVRIIDFVEYNYRLDYNDITLNNSLRAFQQISKTMRSE